MSATFWTHTQAERAREWCLQGYCDAAIAKALGMSRKAVAHKLRELRKEQLVARAAA